MREILFENGGILDSKRFFNGRVFNLIKMENGLGLFVVGFLDCVRTRGLWEFSNFHSRNLFLYVCGLDISRRL